MENGRSQLMNLFLLAFLGGVSLMSWRVGFSLFGVLVPLAVAGWSQLRCAGRGNYNSDTSRISGREGQYFFGVLVVGVVLGAVRMSWQIDSWMPPVDLRQEDVRVEGRVMGFPDIGPNGQKLILEVGNLLAQINVSRWERVWPGDLVSLRGRLILANDLKWTEALKENFFRLGVRAVVDKPLGLAVSEPMDRGLWQSVLKNVFWLRIKLGEILAGVLTEPSASLEAGILIGDRGNLPAEVVSDFQKTGLSHILAISGFNITLVLNLVLFFSLGSGKRKTLLASVVLIGFFVLLTGASASVLRAGVMGLLALFVKTAGRPIAPLKLILLSTVLLVVFNPAILNFDLSFQLSLAATMSLIFFAEKFEMKGLEGWREWVAEGVGLTLAAQVLSLPIICFAFGKISLISPLANLLVGPFIPILMLLGAAAVVLAVIFPWLTFPLAALIELMVSLVMWMVHGMANLPLAQIEFGKGETWLVVIYYLAVFKLFRKRKPAQSFLR